MCKLTHHITTKNITDASNGKSESRRSYTWIPPQQIWQGTFVERLLEAVDGADLLDQVD
jgi:hypothetical protein